MDEDEDLFRHPWEDEAPPRRGASGRPDGGDTLLIPLARAQDAVARLEASVAAASDDVAAGLRARLALFEAAGFLAHRGPAVHPHDLALRDAHLIGSHTLAALTGRLRREAPWSRAAGKGSPTTTSLPRHWPTPATGVASPSWRPCGRSPPSTHWPRRWRSLARRWPMMQRRAPGSWRRRGRASYPACSPPPRWWLPGCPGCRGGPARARARLCRGRALAAARLRPVLRAALLVGAGLPDRSTPPNTREIAESVITGRKLLAPAADAALLAGGGQACGRPFADHGACTELRLTRMAEGCRSWVPRD